jgi:hypothetical protein
MKKIISAKDVQSLPRQKQLALQMSCEMIRSGIVRYYWQKERYRETQEKDDFPYMIGTESATRMFIENMEWTKLFQQESWLLALKRAEKLYQQKIPVFRNYYPVLQDIYEHFSAEVADYLNPKLYKT